jgi:Ohr subfamily peroxiredoxin
MKVLYRTTATATGGRDGRSATADGVLDVAPSTPKELGGASGAGTNPEQLFAAGYSACFLGAMKFVAGQDKIRLPDDTTVTAGVGIGPRADGRGFGIEVDLVVALPSLDRARAEDLVNRAHVVCPYSHATRDNIEVRLAVA